jgi:uncharacterized protein
VRGPRLLASALTVITLTIGTISSGKDVPYLAGHVNDTAGLLPQGDKDRLEGKLVELEKATGAQVAVLTVPSLDGEVLEEYALRVAETWKLGRKDVDDGVLFLIARDDRKMRLEVGYGLEPRLTDALTKRILDNLVRPHFKSGNFAGGIEAGVDAIAGTIQGQDVVPAEAPPGGQSVTDLPIAARLGGLAIFSLVVGVFSLLAVINTGCQSWFLYLFLMPFYAAFPVALLGPAVGWIPIVAWVFGFPLLKLWLGKTPGGRSFLKAHPALTTFAAGSGRSSGGWSSGGGSFSGGGGSFGGGGSSSSW